ncbi:MAG: RNA polymerase sigma factor [Polyangiales bacterium]
MSQSIVSSEAKLIQRCRQGDKEALGQVFRQHAAALEGLLRRVVGPHGDVDDLLQLTFVAAIRAFPKFRGEASLRTWLSRIAVYTARDHLRQADRRRRVDVGAADGGLERAGGLTGASLDQQVARRRQLQRVYAHLQHIDAKKRTAFVLHVFDGRPIEEVAELTGASITATKSRIFWTRKQLLARVRRDPSLRELWEGGGLT